MSVLLEGPEDGFWDGRRGGDVRADGVEAVLVGGVGERDLLAVGSAVREPSVGGYSGAFRTGGAWGSVLMR